MCTHTHTHTSFQVTNRGWSRQTVLLCTVLKVTWICSEINDSVVDVFEIKTWDYIKQHYISYLHYIQYHCRLYLLFPNKSIWQWQCGPSCKGALGHHTSYIVLSDVIYTYIYIYIYREREREQIVFTYNLYVYFVKKVDLDINENFEWNVLTTFFKIYFMCSVLLLLLMILWFDFRLNLYVVLWRTLHHCLLFVNQATLVVCVVWPFYCCMHFYIKCTELWHCCKQHSRFPWKIKLKSKSLAELNSFEKKLLNIFETG